MMNMDEFIQQLKKLKLDCPNTVVVLPPHTHGLPFGSYNLELLLKIIVMNLEHNLPSSWKGVLNDTSQRTY